MTYSLILISGVGKRLGNDLPKQFICVNEKPIFLYALNKFYKCSEIEEIVLVAHKDYMDYVSNLISEYQNKKIHVIEGGNERYLSVFNGLKYLKEIGASDDDKVLIHDGVRANVTSRIILENINTLNTYKAVLTAIDCPNFDPNSPRIDTIHKIDNRHYKAQTPQSFNLGYIFDLYQRNIDSNSYHFFDDISLALDNNDNIGVVVGEEKNYKITTISDLDKFKDDHKKYKAFILDFDGTLFNSKEGVYEAFSYVFSKFNLPLKKEDMDIYLRENIKITADRFNITGDRYKQYFDLFQEAFALSSVQDKSIPFYDTKEFLALAKDSGIKMAVVSSNDSFVMRQIVQKNGIPQFSDIYLGVKDMSKGKPDPEGIYIALDRLNVDKKDVCYIGDSLNDMLAAKNAGIDGILLDRENYFKDKKDYKYILSLLDMFE